MNDTSLIFILGSGRCGTKALVKMLAGTPGLEAHHEYCRYAYQREAVLTAIGYYSRALMAEKLKRIFASAAYYSEAGQFLDSSHKLVPVADLLVDTFPDAKFIHVVRDGRKVAASFYYKLQIHDDRANRLFTEWMNSPGDRPVPPPSEKYWWVPAPEGYDRFQRIAWHWLDSNSRIMEALQDARHKHFARLEDLSADQDELRKFTDFLGVDYSDTYWKAIQKPDHAYVPINYELTEIQRTQMTDIAGHMLEFFGYSGKEQHVNYYKV